jgi:quercetin dioxygenase-like cupin family protein
MDPLFQAPEPARVRGASVTFEPSARTAWHTHPLGQTLIVTAGCGWVQREGGPVEEIRPGDVVWFPPRTPKFNLRLPNFPYLGVFLVRMALSYSPTLVIWTGIASIAAWPAD